MTISTPAEPRTDVGDMLVVHRTFRRELRLLPPLVRAVRPGDTGRAALLADHLALVLRGLQLHHSGEDTLLWPLLLERATPDTALVRRMEAQHELVHAGTGRVEAALERWRVEARPAVADEVADAVDALAEALVEHLDEEERAILPLAATHVSQTEWDALGEHAVGAMPRRDLPLMFGLLLEDATEQERAAMMATLPAPARLVARLVFLPRYRRYISRVRG